MTVEQRSGAPTPLVIDGLALDSTVTRLPAPGQIYAVTPAAGVTSAVVCPADFSVADQVIGNPVASTWSNPELVLAAYGLDVALGGTRELAKSVFGPAAEVAAEIERNPETNSPELIFRVEVAKALRPRRGEFLDRYVREVKIPEGAPIPVLLWAYRDADLA